MSKTLMEKDGAQIRVDDSMVDDHVRLGWVVAVGAIDFSGSDMEVAANPTVSGVLETLFVRHYAFTPAASSAAGVHAAVTLGAAAQNVRSGISNPDYPRNVTIKGNVSGISGDVLVRGTNILDDEISETIALNGATEVVGDKAFKTVDDFDLPEQTHTPTAQVETATAAGTISGSGDASVVITAAGMTGTPKTIAVAVLENDTAAQWAEKVRVALAADAAVAALFTVGGSNAAIVLTRKTPAANDATLNIALDNGTCAGITTAAASANTTAGVGYDTVSVGMSYKFGLPHILGVSSLTASVNGTLSTDADEIEKNLFTAESDPGGSTEVSLWYFA